MDEVRIWNRALCQEEIQNNMNCALNPTGQNGLIALYHFDQGTVNANNAGITTLNDASGNANNGTLNNFALNGATSNWATVPFLVHVLLLCLQHLQEHRAVRQKPVL